MRIEYYNKFIDHQERGLKKLATQAVRDFIASFENEEEISNWVWDFLPKLQKNRHSRVRHEIFCELVYPTLKRGYDSGDFKSTLWLGKLIQDIYQTNVLDDKFSYMTDFDFFRESYEINPKSEKARLLLLECIIKRLEYAAHEWPSGILSGNHGATLEECEEIGSEARLAKALDQKNKYSEFISEFMNKLMQYKSELTIRFT